MKEKFLKRRFFIYPIILLVMVFATFEYANIQVFGISATCCTYGNQCGSETKDSSLKCCAPAYNEAPCSEGVRNYCRQFCE